MNQVQLWEKYLLAKQDVVIKRIMAIASLTELDARSISDFTEAGKVQPPRLAENVEDYNSKPITGQPSNEYISNMPGVGISGLYDGIEVAIPVKGDMELYDKFVYGKFICLGLLPRDGDYVRIKQWVFSNIKTDDELKASIRACVENLKTLLAEVEVVVNDYSAQFRAKVERAFDERRQELTLVKQKLDAANPWG